MDLNRGHFERAGVVAADGGRVSSAPRTEALARKDRTLNELSRVPEVVQHLADDVVGPAKASAAQRSIADATVDHRSGHRRAARRARDPRRPGAAAEAVQALEQAKARLDYLRGPGRQVERAGRRPRVRPVEQRQLPVPAARPGASRS